MEKIFTLPKFGYELTLGKFAAQADGAAWLKQGGTILLATVVSAPSEEFPGFLPLTVDYREMFSAVGKVPGGYFKREGKPSDNEVLTGRLIDRALRPLFPERFFNKMQIQITVYSADKKHNLETLGLLAASLALTTSKVPFMGPVGACQVSRVDGRWISSPTLDQVASSDATVLVAGTEEGINMVEGGAHEVSEKELVDVFFLAHDTIREQVAWQRNIQSDWSVEKEEVVVSFDWDAWQERAKNFLTDERVKTLFVKNKVERGENQKTLQVDFLHENAQALEQENIAQSCALYVFDVVLKKAVTRMIFAQNKRVDLRDFAQIRPITTEVGLLPFAHGSSLFTRGKTQALVSTTLGGGQDALRVDTIMGDVDQTFMVHYNFPFFSVGEVRPSRGTSRRETGHGHLAAKALRPMLPQHDEFPYTIRIVSDILECDGSSSMATVCGTTMSLMNAGVPIENMVSGIAMGLLLDESGDFRVLTDIAGFEDAFGLMDFKVAGTQEGVTAIQMDIKYKGGLARNVFESALEEARKGRLHILDVMKKVMSKPNEKLSDLVPQVVTFKVPRDKIGAIIGSGGKVIREIIERTQTTIDIEDDGLVKIFGHPGELLDQAISWVKILAGLITIGDVYQGVVDRKADFGIFVEIAPGHSGLVHISTIPRAEQKERMEAIQLKEGVRVEVIGYDADSGRIRLKLIK